MVIRGGNKLYIKAVNLWFRYQGLRNYVLNGAFIDGYPGKITTLIGPNGCGKTTLLMILAGLLKPEKGDVLINNESIFGKEKIFRKYIGFVFQNPDDQLFNPTVYDELAFALRQLGYSNDLIHDKVKDISLKLKIHNYLNTPPFKLSFGEKRMVSLAATLIYDPKILILDEPTANLSVKTIQKLIELIVEYKKQGKTIIVSTHDINFAAHISDIVYLLKDGKIIAYGHSQDILTNIELMESIDASTPLPYFIWKELGFNDRFKPLTEKEIVIKLKKYIKREKS